MRVRITGATKPSYWYADKIGEVFEVKQRGKRFETVAEINKVGSYGIIDDTDCVLISEKGADKMADKLTTIKRKANVGERILITDAKITFGRYENGDILKVAEQDGRGVRHIFDDGARAFIYDEEYEVIVVNTSPNEAFTAAHDAIDELRRKAYAEGFDAGRVFVAESKTRVNPFKLGEVSMQETPQQIRDKAIEQAKADVEELKRRGEAYGGTWEYAEKLDGESAYGPGSGDRYNCEFIIDKDKRKVVALLRGYRSGRVRKKGIAKCASDDCFNSHIGRAISLRRALGLDVPAEYMNAPQPTEIRAGDKVWMEGGATHVTRYDHGSINAFPDHKIIDDSREASE